MQSENQEILFLTLEEVIEIHSDGIREHGGSSEIRDIGIIESAALMPQQTFGGEYLLASIYQMAAAYWHGLCMNHGFVDGNKRVALRAADVFLNVNGLDLMLTSDEAFDVTIKIATREISREELAEIIEANCGDLE